MGKAKEATDTDDDWGFLAPEPAPLAKPEPIKLLPKQERLDRLRDLENQLLERSLNVVSDALYFRDIEPGQKEPPPDWGDMDPDEKIKRLRMANAAWLNKKEAPVGIELSKQVAVGIIRARATEKAAPKTLNVAVIQMSAPLPQFEVVEVEADE